MAPADVRPAAEAACATATLPYRLRRDPAAHAPPSGVSLLL
jgi:hypothetical protein